MKKASLNLLKTQSIITIICCMTFAFLTTASILLSQYYSIIKENYKNTVYIAADKKVLELNTFFNTAEAIAKDCENFILDNLDEERLLKDKAYETEFMDILTKMMSSVAVNQKGVISTFFRMEMYKYGPTKGIFLTGGYHKSFVRVRPTDLSKYSPTDVEHVGWYYHPVWNKAPIWLSPYLNENLGQKMISYCIPVYRNDELLGIVGIDLSLAIINDIVSTHQLSNSQGLLIGVQQNLINLNTMEDLSKAVDRSANLSTMMEKFRNSDGKNLVKFHWDGRNQYGVLRKLDNDMSYVLSTTSDEFININKSQVLSLLIAFLIVCALTAILITFALVKILIPIKIITRTTNRLARGELHIEIPYNSKNEIGTLAGNIRMMTTQLKEYIEYISEQTKKERAEKEAALTESQINAAASKAKSAFLANMSHEIRTPINAVLGMDEMILRESKDKAILNYATNIKLAGSNLLSIVNDVLDFSKIEAGKMELLPDNYETSSMIIDLMNMTRERAKKKGLNYELNITSDLPKTLYGDSIRIKQCILNLITNAIKYTKEGSITFSVSYNKVNDAEILLIVKIKDTGCGIKKEDINKLFTPFERIEEEKNRTIEGSGLGISIVKKLLDMMGSKLNVISQYGKGSEFSFGINQKVIDWTEIGDINEAYKESVEELTNYQEKLHAPKAKLLFVDDTEMNLDVIKGLLKNTGMQIDTVLSGKDALEAVKNTKYDILFIDHRMPEMDGIQTLHAMKNMSDNLCINKPCIALTANAINGVKKMYLEEGFDDYLSKPVNPAKLEEMIRQHLPQDYIEEPGEENSSDDYSDFISQLNDIEEITTSDALRFCGSSEILYSTMEQYFSTIETKAAELQNFFDQEDWKNYEIKVHSLKSTSRLIGANDLSKQAEHLEKCADQGNIEEIKAKHETLIETYLSLKQILKPLVKTDSETSQKPEISSEQLSEKLKQLSAYADDFNIDGLDKVISELSEYTIPFDFSQKFDNIKQSVSNVDFKELKVLLSEWSNN